MKEKRFVFFADPQERKAENLPTFDTTCPDYSGLPFAPHTSQCFAKVKEPNFAGTQFNYNQKSNINHLNINHMRNFLFFLAMFLMTFTLNSQTYNLSVPYENQDYCNWEHGCGYYSLQMVISYYENTTPTDALVNTMTQNYHGTNVCDAPAASYSDLVSIAKNYGFNSESYQYSSTWRGVIETDIQNGFPILVLVHTDQFTPYKPWVTDFNHWVVIRGYDNSYVYANDPGRNSTYGNNKKVSWSDFENSLSRNNYRMVRVFSSVDPPSIYTPTDNSTNVTIPVNFDWSDAIGSSPQYRIQVSTSNSGWTATNGFTTSTEESSSIRVNQNTSSTSSYSWTSSSSYPPQSNTKYYWTVKSYVNGVSSNYSAVKSFTTSSGGSGSYCSGTTNLSGSGTFDDGSGSSNYSDNANCKWLISSSGAAAIILHFNSFNTESGSDYVKVYDGSTTSAKLLGSYSGTNIPSDVTSSGSSILVHFTTDNSVTRAGWSIDYTSTHGGASDDFYIENASVTPTSVLAGETIDVSCNQYYSGNTLNADIADPYVGYYLSTNTSFSSSNDVYLGEDYSGIGSDDLYDGESANLTIPSGTTSGTYYILFVADYTNLVSEDNESNNVSYVQITVTGGGSSDDIYIQNQSVTPTSVAAGGTIDVNCDQYFSGINPDANVNDPYVGYYLSTNTNFSSSNDVYLGEDYSGIGSDDLYDGESATLTIPSGTSAGTYYILFVADYTNVVSESDENNNVSYFQITVTGGGSSDDIYIQNQSVTPTSVAAGGTIDVNCDQYFSGINPDANVNDPYVAYYLSTNTSFSASSDIYLGEDISGIGSDDLYDGESATLTIPSGTSAGTYYILFVADYTNVVSETDENNNVSYVQISVTGSITNYTISLSSNPTAGGTTSGAGTYTSGSSQTVNAIANSGYTFTNWTENGTVVSPSLSYTFTLTGNRTLVANFTYKQIDLTTGLIAYYPFNGNANDISGNNNHGVDLTGVTFVAGKDGQAAKFGGYSSPSHIRVPNSTSLQFTTEASFVYWVRLDNATGMDGWGNLSANGNHCVFAKSHDRSGITNNMGYTSLNKLYSGLGSSNGGGIGSKVQGIGAYNIGSWIHVAYSCSGTNSTLYVNGVQDSTANTPLIFSTSNTQDLFFGKYSDYWYPLNGALDEMRIYNRALNATEIQQLYNKPTGLFDVNVQLPEFQLFPNPANTFLQISSPEILQRIEVCDIAGRLIFTKTINSDKCILETNKFVGGIYIVTGFTNQGIITGKFVRE